MVEFNEKIFQSYIKNNVLLGHSKKKLHTSNLNNVILEIDGSNIIDPESTYKSLNDACAKLKDIAASKKKILFVCTKEIASGYIKRVAIDLDMPYVDKKWLPGVLTNFAVLKQVVKKKENLKMYINNKNSNICEKGMSISKSNILLRNIEKKCLISEGISKKLYKMPGALVIVDAKNENIAVNEANSVGVPIFALADTDTCLDNITDPIHCNDDSLSSIMYIVEHLKAAISEGLNMIQQTDESNKDIAVQG